MWATFFPCDPADTTISIFGQVPYGEPADWWHNHGFKPCIFNPKIDISFVCGRHAKLGPVPTERIDSIKLLHYRNLGYEYYKWHHDKNAARLSPKRKDKTWGQHNFNPISEHEFWCKCSPKLNPNLKKVISDENSSILHPSE